MKKRTIIVLVLCMVLSLYMAGCAKKGKQSTGERVQQQSQSAGVTVQQQNQSTVQNSSESKEIEEDEKAKSVVFFENYHEDRVWALYNTSEYLLLDTEGNAVIRSKELNPAAGIDNGYTHAMYGMEHFYTIRTDGEVTFKFTSDYSGEKCLACGGGYLVSIENISNFDTVGYQYRVYNPNGSINGTFTSEMNYDERVHYVGRGVFRVGEGYYCAKSAKWIEEIPYSYSSVNSGFYDDKKIIGMIYTGKEEQGKILTLSETGDLQIIHLDGVSYNYRISQIVDNICLIHDISDGNLSTYNILTGERWFLDQNYYNKLSSDFEMNTPTGGRIALSMEGADGNTYSAVFDTKFNLISDIQLGKFGIAAEGRFVVWGSPYGNAVYDLNGNYLFSITDMEFRPYIVKFAPYEYQDTSVGYSCGMLIVQGNYLSNQSKIRFIDMNGNWALNKISFNNTKTLIK